MGKKIPNMQDATLRNIRALKNQVAWLKPRVVNLIQRVKELESRMGEVDRRSVAGARHDD